MKRGACTQATQQGRMKHMDSEPNLVRDEREKMYIVAVPRKSHYEGGYPLLETRVKPSRPAADEQPICKQASALADESLCKDVGQGPRFPNFCVWELNAKYPCYYPIRCPSDHGWK